jgi:hypothetical protein
LCALARLAANGAVCDELDELGEVSRRQLQLRELLLPLLKQRRHVTHEPVGRRLGLGARSNHRIEER